MNIKQMTFISAALTLSLSIGSVWANTAQKNDFNYPKIDLAKTDDFSDLAPFGEAIKNKKVIYLDELTHGEHEVFKLKSRLIKYLHQQHHFSVLLLESGLYDVAEIVKNATEKPTKTLAEQAPGHIFYGYVKDPSFIDLLNYIDHSTHNTNNPNIALKLAGFDGRLSGEHSIRHFVSQLKQQVEQLPKTQQPIENWPEFARILQSSLTREKQELSQQQIQQHIQQNHKLMDALKAIDKHPAIGSPAYYARALAGVVRLFEVQYEVRRFDEHDLVMADNIDWLMQYIYPNEKVIIWGHYIHLNRQGYVPLRHNNVATALKRKYGEQAHYVNFSGLSGQFREFRDNSVLNIPKLTKQHLAYQLQERFDKSSQALLIQPSQFTAKRYQNLVLYGHEYKAEYQIKVSQWQNHFDSVFLINQVTASN